MSKRKHRFDYHHRLPKSLGGTDTFPANNIAKVNKLRHAKWHGLFGNRTVESIVYELNEMWLDPRIKLIITLKGDGV